MAKKEKVKSPQKERKFQPSMWICSAIIMLAMWLVGVLLPHRLTVLLCMVGGIASIVACIVGFRCLFSRKANGDAFIWLLPFGMVCGIVSFMGCLFTFRTYNFYQEPVMPFWELSLILGLLVGVFVTVKWTWRHFGWWLRLGSIALCTFLAFVVIWASLCHLNYLLDFHPPMEKHAVIEEKEITRHRKSPNSYEFELTVDGESFDLEVGEIEYKKYEVGDTYTFRAYKGAFGKPFYLAKE